MLQFEQYNLWLNWKHKYMYKEKWVLHVPQRGVYVNILLYWLTKCRLYPCRSGKIMVLVLAIYIYEWQLLKTPRIYNFILKDDVTPLPYMWLTTWQRILLRGVLKSSTILSDLARTVTTNIARFHLNTSAMRVLR